MTCRTCIKSPSLLFPIHAQTEIVMLTYMEHDPSSHSGFASAYTRRHGPASIVPAGTRQQKTRKFSPPNDHCCNPTTCCARIERSTCTHLYCYISYVLPRLPLLCFCSTNTYSLSKYVHVTPSAALQSTPISIFPQPTSNPLTRTIHRRTKRTMHAPSLNLIMLFWFLSSRIGAVPMGPIKRQGSSSDYFSFNVTSSKTTY